MRLIHAKTPIAAGLTLLVLALGSATAGAAPGGQEMAMPPAALPAAAATEPAAPKKSGMGGMMDGMMGMEDDKMAPAMPLDADMPMPDASASMQDTTARSNADMMGRMRGSMSGDSSMGKLASAPTLPGFPGASRLYHIGATGFFLDHSRHIGLTAAQATTLDDIKQRTLLVLTGFDRRIEGAEQSLWMMTAADVPHAGRIDAQVRSIEKLRGDQRMAFIRGVGEAGKVLTVAQQRALLGKQSPTGTMPMPASRPAPKPTTPPAAPMAPMAPMADE
jgi:hypothetical protein